MHINAHSGAVATTPCTVVYKCGVLCSTRSLHWVGLAQHQEGTGNRSVNQWMLLQLSHRAGEEVSDKVYTRSWIIS